MTKRLTMTLAICTAAAAITVGALFSQPAPNSAPPAGAAPSGAAPSGAPVLTIEGFAFFALPVDAGATVQVINLDGAPHTVSGDAFDIGLDPGGTASFTAPAAPGTYSFVCFVHPTMTGELVVR